MENKLTFTESAAPSSSDPILNAASELFYTKGIRAVSIQMIRQRANVSLKALYTAYPSKDDLITAYLQLTHDAWMKSLREAVWSNSEEGSEKEAIRLGNLFEWLASWFASPDFIGCGIANTRGEKLPQAAVLVTKSHVRELQEEIEKLLAPRFTKLTPEVFLLVEGAISAAAATGDPKQGILGKKIAQGLLG